MKVKYTGLADYQVFNKADFEKANLDQGKLQFKRNEPTEVPDEVGKALIAKDGIFGGHSFSEVAEEESSTPAPEGDDLLSDTPSPASTRRGKSN
jgi:hypothetical protein